MQHPSLAPGLLLASPSLGDPNFEKTVVLLGHHDDEGALGWIINGTTLMTVEELLRSSGMLSPALRRRRDQGQLGPGLTRPAQLGGPVDPVTGWILFRHTEFAPDNVITLGSGLGVTGDAAALTAVINGEGPDDFRLLVGYSGWGPGQLEDELREGAWLPAPADALLPALVFETPNERIWEEAYRRLVGTGPEAFAPGRRGLA